MSGPLPSLDNNYTKRPEGLLNSHVIDTHTAETLVAGFGNKIRHGEFCIQQRVPSV